MGEGTWLHRHVDAHEDWKIDLTGGHSASVWALDRRIGIASLKKAIFY